MLCGAGDLSKGDGSTRICQLFVLGAGLVDGSSEFLFRLVLNRD